MEEKPVVYIIHGDDSFAMRQFVEALYARMGDAGIAELNTSRLDGRSATDEEINAAAASLPFLAERRLTILTQPLARLKAKAAQERFTALLDGLPVSCALVLVIDDAWERKGGVADWQVLRENHWLKVWAAKAGKRALLRAFSLPRAAEMPGWISKTAQERGGRFAPPAARALADLVGSDTQIASQEIDKLLIYADGRLVEAEDVAECTASIVGVSVFDMVDAVAAADTPRALRLLRQSLEEGDPYSLLGLLAGHFRALVATKELLEEGGGVGQVMEELHRPKFVAEKLAAQAARFSMAGLEETYRGLARVDAASKSGQMPADLALETFVTALRVR